VLDVQPSPVPGVYEVFVGDGIIYSDADADYLFLGPLVDAHTRQNLTDARMNELGRIDFHSLPFDRAIKVVKGNGSRQFAVFSDPDCPFCLQLEKSLVSVNDVTMYVFLFPIASLHPQAPPKARAIWCAKDRAQAWTQWMHEKKLPSSGACSGDPIDELQRLGDKLHISATPTIFFADGRKIAGAITTEQIEKQLAAATSGSSPRS
jgi:thiol:disulfide interchange protein DsbC